jgi:hypothetical protein
VLHSSRRRMRRIPPVVALLAVVLLAADADARQRYFGGTTSQGAPIVVQLTADGKRVDFVRVLAQGECDDGGTLSYWARVDVERRVPRTPEVGRHVVPDPKLGRSGRFGGEGEGVAMYGETVVGVMSEDVRGTVRGSGRATGTLSTIVVLTDIGTGELSGTCQTGELTWSARSKRGRIYAGATDNGTPVVAELTGDRSEVEHFRFGWAADCVPEGQVIAADDVGDFPITDSRFGDAFEIPVEQDGMALRVAYDLSGGVRKTSASGSVAVKLTGADPAGNEVLACDAGRFGWKARSG